MRKLSVSAIGVISLSLLGCAASQPSYTLADQARTISVLADRAASHPRRAYRKPARDKRDRALAMIADHARQLQSQSDLPSETRELAERLAVAAQHHDVEAVQVAAAAIVPQLQSDAGL